MPVQWMAPSWQGRSSLAGSGRCRHAFGLCARFVDEVVWRMQFEEEPLARLQRPKLRRSAGLPEIDFVVRSGRAQLVKPGFVRNSDEEADHRSTPLVRCDHPPAPDAWLLSNLQHHASSSLRRRVLIPLLMVSATSAGNPFGREAVTCSTALIRLGARKASE